MQYQKIIALKDGRLCCLRNGMQSDGAAMFRHFNLTHGQTDYLLSYPDENSFSEEQEGVFLKNKAESGNEIQLIALVDGVIAGSAGIEAVGKKFKVRHRAEFGICVDQAYWGLGIGWALTESCIQCARDAGYLQLELEAVAENARALSLYRKAGFVEYGRNPRGFSSRRGVFQEIVYMRMEL